MSDENWMTRLLSDARDLALQASRAKLQAQQQQLAAAERRIAELSEELREQQARASVLEGRVIGLLRELLGEPGMLALRELLDAEGIDGVERLEAVDRELLDRLR
jgi:hypothetical protein